MNFKAILVLLVIALLGTFGYFKYVSTGSETNSFNLTTRYQFGRYSFIRTLLGLHKEGDARGWYLVGSGPIAIQIVKPENVELTERLTKDFADLVKEHTGRDVQVFNLETIKGGSLTGQDIKEIIKSKKSNYLPGQPNLLVIVADDFQSLSEESAKTYAESTIVLSYQRLVDQAQRNRGFTDDYLEYMMLHEFGHQLGLKHNDKRSCIMSSQAEDSDLVIGYSNLPKDFCDYEVEQLSGIKSSVK